MGIGESLKKFGYTNLSIIKMFKNSPGIISQNTNTIVSKLNNLVKIGYSYDDVLSLTSSVPSILNYSELSIQRRFDLFMNLGFTKDQVLEMIYKSPALLTYSEERIKKIAECLDNIGILHLAPSYPTMFFTGVKTIYARYNFLTQKKGIVINSDSFMRLFYNSKTFEKIYGISKEELIDNYGYVPDFGTTTQKL